MSDQADTGAPRVLLVGLAPADVDLSSASIDRDELEAQVQAGLDEVTAAGYDAVSLQVDPDPARGADQVRRELDRSRPAVVMIGGGIRAVPAQTELFERIVEAVRTGAPDARFAFNTGPTTTLAALRRASGGQ